MYLLLAILLFYSCCRAQTVTPFTLDGGLDSATASSSDYNSGGTISVNGWTITIPQNLQVQFPAAFVPFKDFASGSFTGHEVSVIGNVVNGQAIAGLVQISQFLFEAGTGLVEKIDFAGGSMKIANGPTIRINDPNAVYSVGYTPNPFYTADDENPSITSFSGFPMCIPRSSSDTKCPASNRPAGQSTFSAPDPLTMAPFQVGDYLEYSGVKIGGEVICYTIVVPNVQITTSGAPTYIRVEDSIIGVYDGGATSEFADTRFIGYSSDATSAITIYALDIDPCTGAETERSVGSASYKAGDVRNKWTWRADSTTLSKYTREYRIRASSGEKLTTNGITAGQYVQPVTDWIMPEANVPGIVPPVNDFTQFTHLANGFGRDGAGNLWGQLSPWPGATAPSAVSCAPAAASSSATSASPSGASTASSSSPPTGTPSASAGSDQTVRPGILGSLAGKVSNSGDFGSSDLSYNWTQISGPSIKLSATTVLNPSFTAPATSATVKCVFALKVTSAAAGTNSTSNITITNDPSLKDVVVVDSYTWTSQQSGTISVTAHTNVIDGTATKMTLYLSNTASGTGLAMTSLGGGKFSYSARSTKKPANGVTVQSQFLGTGSSASTTAKRRRRWLSGGDGVGREGALEGN